MKSLRKRAYAKASGQRYKTIRHGCILINKYGSVEVPYIFENYVLLALIKRNAETD